MKQKTTISKLNKANQQEEKRHKRKQKNQRCTNLHTQEPHRNTKLEAIIRTQKTWYRPVQALCLLL